MVVLLVLVGLAIIIAALFGAVSWLTKGRVQQAAAAANNADVVAPPGHRAASPSEGAATTKSWALAPSLAPGQGAAGEPSLEGHQPVTAAETQEPADPRAGSFVQSFSCSEKLSVSRSWICTHWSLATEDYNLSLQYRSALTRSRDPQALRKARAAWLAKLDTLGANSAAISRSYRQWRDQLSAY